MLREGGKREFLDLKGKRKQGQSVVRMRNRDVDNNAAWPYEVYSCRIYRRDGTELRVVWLRRTKTTFVFMS